MNRDACRLAEPDEFGPHYLRNAMLGSPPAAKAQVEYPFADRMRMPSYDASRWNRLGYGENLDAVLPCRKDSCRMRAYCPLSDEERRQIWYGEPCPDEQLFFNTYVDAFVVGWGRIAGLVGDEARAVGEKMALLELRRARLSMRMREMWDLGPRLQDGSTNPDFLHEMALCGRYMTQMDRELARMRRKLFGSDLDD